MSQKEPGFINAREERLAKVNEFNLLSNDFMTVALNDIPACQHILRVLTGIDELQVKEIRTQHRISKITSRDAILDVLAEDANRKIYSVEVQKKDTIDHARRTRFYNSMVDSEFLEKGSEYHNLPEILIIYISEKDLWKAGKAIYYVNKQFAEMDIPYDDGTRVMYVNASVNDGTEIAKLMDYFKKADPNDMSQGDLSKRIRFLKCEEGGKKIMCEVRDSIFNEGKMEGIREGILKGKREGKREGKRQMINNLLRLGLPIEDIAKAAELSISTVRQWMKSI